MKLVRLLSVATGLLLLAGCGGGSGGSGGGTSSQPLTVTLASSSSSATVYEDEAASDFSYTATITGSAKTPVVQNIQYDPSVFSSVTGVLGAGGLYTISATPVAKLGGGDYTGTITLRLCQETACTHVYPGTSAIYTYHLTVKLRDWAMYQRNAAHTGYVHVKLDSSKFKQVWSWDNPDNNFISAAISGNGYVYISAAPGKTYAFNEATGAQIWMNNMTSPTQLYARGGLAFNKGVVYVAAYGPSAGSLFTGDSTIRGLDSATGSFQSDSGFVSQVNNNNSPTILNDEMFYAHGYYGGVLSKYALPSGATSWTSSSTQSNQYTGEAPAVDDKYVYYTNGWGLTVYDKINGTVYKDFSDPRTISTSYSAFISPVITPSGHVLYVNQQEGDVLNDIDVDTGKVLWKTSYNYNLQPAIAGGVVYISRGYPFGIEAINETDGALLWNWAIPSTDNNVIENLIVCDNLLFVSTDKATYAIDLTTHQAVWSTPAHGMLSLSSNYMLYIVTDDYSQNGKLTAISLKD